MTTFREPALGQVPPPVLRLLRAPGVYRPQADTRLLAEVAANSAIPAGARVLDICTGTGALAVTAGLLGAADVTALDVSRRAVLSARLNAWRHGQQVRVLRGCFVELPQQSPFDVILANPPYVPCAPDAVTAGRTRAWNAGPDGRALLDPICRSAADLLTESGFLLLVHSSVSGEDRSLELLRDSGLHTRVVASRRNPFGPVMRSRAAFLEQRGLITPGQRHEDLVVIRADRT